MGQQDEIMEFKMANFQAGSTTDMGDIATIDDKPVSQSVYASWQRSFDNGIYVDDFINDSFLENDALSDVLELNRTIIEHACPEMNKLFQLIKDDGNMILLADKNGVILNQMGDPNFVKRAEQILLACGAKWGEADKGTNAIGTAIAENRAITIHGGEHYLNANSFLTCSSVPIHNPYGNVLGVLDITGDYRNGNKHTLALLNMSVEHIENEMFNSGFHQDIIVELYQGNVHSHWFNKVILVFDFRGMLIAANRSAINQFKLSRLAFGRKYYSDMFDGKINQLIDHIILSNRQSYELKDHNGMTYFAKAKTSYARLRNFSSARKRGAATPDSAPTTRARIGFADIDLGDSQTAENIARIKKIVPHDIPILLQGETGTGKEWMARAIHNYSDRSEQPFIAINCASLPKALIESELFGNIGGVLTSADANEQKGKIIAATGGYLFLDEVGGMPLELQTRLLQALEERQFYPLGSTKSIEIDIRVISATNLDLSQAVEDGTFRRDLYYRLNGLSINLPSLTDRNDFIAVVKAILHHEFPDRKIKVSKSVWDLFAQHIWAGNIRQLHNILKVSAVICEDNIIRKSDLPAEFLHSTEQDNAEPMPNDLIMSFDEGDKIVIQNMLKTCDNNLSKTARKLGISRNTLYSKLKQFGLR